MNELAILIFVVILVYG